MTKRIPDDDLPRGTLREELGDPAARAQIVAADVVFGVDVKDETQEVLFYGRRALKQIAKSGEGRELDVARVTIDLATDDVEALIAACRVLKGSCCYDFARPDDDPRFN
jgi:hypothetical protein